MCLWSARVLIGFSIKFTYATPLLMDLGLRRTVPFGDRSERMLMPLEDVITLDCCNMECAHTLGERGVTRHWNLYERCTTLCEQDLFIVKFVLFSDTFGCSSPWCNDYLAAVFGLSSRRISGLRLVGSDYAQVLDEQLLEDSYKHGNSGRTPVNVTSEERLKVLRRVYDKFTRSDPSRAIVHVHAEDQLGGKGTLRKKFRAEAEAAVGAAHDSTLDRAIYKFMQADGCYCLSVHSPGHNMCMDCKEVEMMVQRKSTAEVVARHIVQDATAAQQNAVTAASAAAAEADAEPTEGGPYEAERQTAAAADSAAELLSELENLKLAHEKVVKELAEAKAAGEEHIGTHYEIAHEVSKLTGLAQALAARHALECQARADAGQPVPVPTLRSVPTIEFNCFDDKTAASLPHKPEEETGVQQKLSIAINGQCDLVGESSEIYALDSSASNKNADHVVNECALSRVMGGTGARVLAMLSDMGPLNHNLALTVLFGQFLCDLGMYDMVITIFLQRYHSKQICDRM